MSISITKTAAKRIQHLINNKQNANAFSFTVKEAGCSGYSYVMDVIDVDDSVEGAIISEQHGVTVVSDKKSLELLNGTQIDYVTEGLNSTFKFINPNAEAECGCGGGDEGACE